MVPGEAVPLFLVGTLVLFIGTGSAGCCGSRPRGTGGRPSARSAPEDAEAFLIGFLRRDYGRRDCTAWRREDCSPPAGGGEPVTMTLSYRASRTSS